MNIAEALVKEAAESKIQLLVKDFPDISLLDKDHWVLF
jgi:hypothetical protein